MPKEIDYKALNLDEKEIRRICRTGRQQISDIRRQQIFDLCCYAWNNAKIPVPKKRRDIFRLVAKIWNPDQIDMDEKWVKVFYDQVRLRNMRKNNLFIFSAKGKDKKND